MHWLVHVAGLDSQTGIPYMFWSGVGAQFKLSNLFLPAIYYQKHKCHEPGCWRIGRHDVSGTPWCDRHHHEARKP